LDPDSLNINLSSVEQAITPKTKAVVACHLYGNPVDIRGLQHLCESRQLHLIEDISHSPGASVAGRPVGSFGQMAFCSMQAAKVIAGGEAGFLLTNDSDFYHRAVELAHPKRIGRLLSAHHRYQGVGLGFKFRPSALHVALAHDAYRQLDASNAVRRDMFEHFRTALGNIPEITFPAMVPDAARVYWEYELLLSNGARVAHVARTMQDQGYIVGTTKLHLLPDLPHFADGLNLAPCPNARHLRDRLLVIRALSQVAPLTAEALGHALRKTIRGGPT
jgi:dTDP-4-amino-4,6-dideoxygalactose transaminase